MNLSARLGLALCLITLISVLQPAFADPPLPTPIGRVIWVKGSLKATMTNNEQRVLQKMSIIYLHDILTTDNQSEAQITFSDNSSVTFYPNTKFLVDKYSFSKKQQGGSVGSYVANLLEGGFRTITGLIAKNNPNDYQVNTPVATIGVRGTDYAVAIKGGQVYVNQYSGTPCVKSNNTAGELCLSTGNQYAMVSSASTAPVSLKQQPQVFKEQLNVTPATISPFGVTAQGVKPSNGVVTSFCISQ